VQAIVDDTALQALSGSLGSKGGYGKAKTAAFALQKIHFSNDLFWRTADAGSSIWAEGFDDWTRTAIGALARSEQALQRQARLLELLGLTGQGC
jgi:hypothetical protein